MRYAPAISILLTFVLVFPALSLGADSLNVLFINSWHEGMPWQEEIEKGFEKHFREAGGEFNLYQEYMDTGRFKSDRQVAIFQKYLAEKYTSERIDYVIAESGGAARLLTRYPDLFEGSKVMLLNPGKEFEAGAGPGKEGGRRHAIVIPVNMDTDRVALELLSTTRARNIYIVADSTEHGKARVDEFTESLSRVEHKRKVHYLVGLPMEQLLQRVSVLGPDSIIVYLLCFMDGEGKRYIPYDAAALISERASVPVYSFWTSLLGSGVVGGYMLSGELVGREAADLLMHPERIGETGTVDLTEKFHGHFYDWRQLKRWGIKARHLPPGSKVLFEEMSFYRHYYREFAVVIVLTVLLFIVVRNRELRAYSERIDRAHSEMQGANRELGKTKLELEQMNLLLRELSVRDDLTGLYNRRHMDDAIHSEVVRAQRYGGDVSIIMADIDFFKAINDRHGHHVGDGVLVRLSATLRQHLRATDTIGRWGGEEFLILCPNLDEWRARGTAEKLLGIVRDTDFGLGHEVTCSFGVAAYEPGNTDSQLIINADRALYEAKNSGRNCVKSQRDL